MTQTRTDIYWQEFQTELKNASGFEDKINLLRRFPKRKQKELQHQAPPLLSLFEELTSLAEAVVRGSFEVSLEELIQRYPAPKGAFGIVAMGKFGGRELTWRSDLDIIYLFELFEDQEFYSRLGTRIISALTLLTREGQAYQIDAALRPSGNQGTLVSTLDSFSEYHQKMGRTWERQALIKARPVAGNPEFFEKILKACHEISYERPIDPVKTKEEIRHLRDRMEKELAREKPGRYNLKTGRGGIVDIEFSVQYLQLVHGKSHPAVQTQNTMEGLQKLAAEGLVDGEIANRFEKAYLFYRTIETKLRLLLDQPTDDLVEGAEWMKGIDLKAYLEMREEIRALYDEVFE